MWNDDIVEEIRTIREQYAAQFDYDIQAMLEALKEEEKQSGRMVVSFTEEQPEHKKIAVNQ